MEAGEQIEEDFFIKYGHHRSKQNENEEKNCTVATKPPVKRKYAEIGDFHGTRDICVRHICSMDLPMDSHEGVRGCFPVRVGLSRDLLLNVKIVEEERCESCNTAFNLLRKGINSTAKRSKANPLIFRRQAYISHDRASFKYNHKDVILRRCKQWAPFCHGCIEERRKIGHRISKNHGNQGKICIDVFKLPTETQYAETKDNQSLIQYFGASNESIASTSFVKGKCASLPLVKLPPPPPPPPPVIPT
uniref:Uncharacterized protein n=1 Tax=Magallana gigas TaxID=29159 RepID=K1QGR3_MAGGI